jgi:hypothetical protein
MLNLGMLYLDGDSGLTAAGLLDPFIVTDNSQCLGDRLKRLPALTSTACSTPRFRVRNTDGAEGAAQDLVALEERVPMAAQ